MGGRSTRRSISGVFWQLHSAAARGHQADRGDQRSWRHALRAERRQRRDQHHDRGRAGDDRSAGARATAPDSRHWALAIRPGSGGPQIGAVGSMTIASTKTACLLAGGGGSTTQRRLGAGFPLRLHTESATFDPPRRYFRRPHGEQPGEAHEDDPVTTSSALESRTSDARNSSRCRRFTIGFEFEARAGFFYRQHVRRGP